MPFTKLRHHGDVLLASPVLGTLKEHLSQANNDGPVYSDTHDMMSGHSALRQLHLVTKRSPMREEWCLRQVLRTRRYDLMAHRTSSARDAWLAHVLRPAVSVAPTQPGTLYQNSFTHLYLQARARHMFECYLDALHRIRIWPEDSDKKLVSVAGAHALKSDCVRQSPIPVSDVDVHAVLASERAA